MAELKDYRYVLSELVEGLAEKASAIDDGSPYSSGRKMAYFEALQAIADLAEEVGVDASEFGIEKVNRQSLVGLKSAA